MRTTTRFLPPLLLLLAMASGGCGVFTEAAPTPTPTPTVTPTVTPTPTPTSTPTPSPTPTPQPRVETPSQEVAQGGVAVLRVSGTAVSAAATFEGRQYPLLSTPDGFWGIIGIAADHATGAAAVSIFLHDDKGEHVAELSATIVVVDTAYPFEEIILPPDPEPPDPALIEQARITRRAILADFTPERLWSGAFQLPVPSEINSPYGIGRSYNGGPVSSFHRGIDFSAAEGTPVAAANAGRIAFVGDLALRGISIIIDHGAGVFSGYHHLSSTAVQEGQRVAKGDIVGYSGDTGQSTGPHLHWEIIVRGVEVDALAWTEREIGP